MYVLIKYAKNPFKILRGLAHAQNDAYLGMDVGYVQKCCFVGRGTRLAVGSQLARRRLAVGSPSARSYDCLTASYGCLTASEVAPQ